MMKAMRHIIGGASLTAVALLSATPVFAQLPPWAQQQRRYYGPPPQQHQQQMQRAPQPQHAQPQHMTQPQRPPQPAPQQQARPVQPAQQPQPISEPQQPAPQQAQQKSAPAPVPQEFVVYFPFDQYVLTPEAQGVIQQAAAYAQQGTPTSVVVVGHADTSGSKAYNVRLSERRAKAVADSLVGMGVNQGAMQVDWRGETNLAVQTGDGVKEPLNRRTTIGINF